MLREALYYEKSDDMSLHCLLCPHGCTISEDKSGICGVRRNKGGTLYTENYGMAAAIAMDPVEKKPLYHFYPGKYLLSIGTIGCNFRCSFCQNHPIAQPEHSELINLSSITGDYLLSLCKQEDDCIGVAYTYNEPSIWYEFVLDTSRFINQNGFKNVLVTNGYISEKPLLELLPFIDAMNIDVKAFNSTFYKEICGGKLEEVKRTVEIAAKACHVEITTLVIPDLNDNPSEIDELASWLAALSPSIPLHLTRYFPRHKMEKSPTPIGTLKLLKETAEQHLKYVYIGNV